MKKNGKIVVVDDNKNVLAALRLLLGSQFEEVTLLSSPNNLISILDEKKPDVVLLDMNFNTGINTGNEGLFWLNEVKKRYTDIPVVLFTAYADIELAVNALKQGASDFVVKPWDNAKLIATLRSAYSLSLSRKEVKSLKEKQSTLSQQLLPDEEIYWGESDVMQKLMQLIKKVAKTDANVLITGENGTGKGVAARMIHQLSARNQNALISVDLGAVSQSLFESELFGHTKGSFTDAKADRAGKFEAADGGTLFLDEIGNLDYPLQAKLLAALQTRTIVRVGSNNPIPVDIRLITATNQDLPEMVENGSFREDLLYRINTIHIEMPPLRNRKEDIPQLAEHFLRRFAHKYGKSQLMLSKETIELLTVHSWPGNIRELQNTLEKAVILADKSELIPEDLYLTPKIEQTSTFIGKSLEEMEQDMIQGAMKRHNGNLSAVAEELGISRQTLYNKMKKYAL